MVECTECSHAMQFLSWRGLGMVVSCPACGHTQYDDGYAGLEDDLNSQLKGLEKAISVET